MPFAYGEHRGEADRAVEKRLCPWWYPQVGNEVNVFAALGDVGDVGVFSGHPVVPRIDDGSAGERYLLVPFLLEALGFEDGKVALLDWHLQKMEETCRL